MVARVRYFESTRCLLVCIYCQQYVVGYVLRVVSPSEKDQIYISCSIEMWSVYHGSLRINLSEALTSLNYKYQRKAER